MGKSVCGKHDVAYEVECPYCEPVQPQGLAAWLPPTKDDDWTGVYKAWRVSAVSPANWAPYDRHNGQCLCGRPLIECAAIHAQRYK